MIYVTRYYFLTIQNLTHNDLNYLKCYNKHSEKEHYTVIIFKKLFSM